MFYFYCEFDEINFTNSNIFCCHILLFQNFMNSNQYSFIYRPFKLNDRIFLLKFYVIETPGKNHKNIKLKNIAEWVSAQVSNAF